MNVNTFNIESSQRKIFKYALLLCALSLPLLVPNWHGKTLILLGIVWIISFKGKQIMIGVERNYFFFMSFLLILIYLVGILFSSNKESGWASLESLIPLLILPVIIFSSEELVNNKVLRGVLISFAAGVIILNLASLAFISYDLWDAKNLQSNIILANNSIVQIHPAFVSLYLSFSIFFLLDQYFPLQTKNRSMLGWILFSLIVLVTYLVWINSRTGILSFCAAFIFYSFYRFYGRARIAAMSILVIFFTLIYSVPFSRERFFNTPLLALSGSASFNSEDPNIYPLTARKQILDCSIELLKGPEFFYGYGTGDFRDVLRDCYKQKNYNSLYESGLDSHNEYFAQLHRHGIVGLLLFLALMIVPFKYALKYRSPLLAVFIILFAITALFENVFSAQKGVTFFALFCPLLMLYARKKYESYEDSNEPV